MVRCIRCQKISRTAVCVRCRAELARAPRMSWRARAHLVLAVACVLMAALVAYLGVRA